MITAFYGMTVPRFARATHPERPPRVRMSTKSSCSAVIVTVSASRNTNAVSPMGTGDTRAGVWLTRTTASCIRGHSSIALDTVRAISATPSRMPPAPNHRNRGASLSRQQSHPDKSNSQDADPSRQGGACGLGNSRKTGARLRGHMCGGADVLQICIDVRVIGRQQCGALIVEHGQSRLSGSCVRVSQVVKAICRVPWLRRQRWSARCDWS